MRTERTRFIESLSKTHAIFLKELMKNLLLAQKADVAASIGTAKGDLTRSENLKTGFDEARTKAMSIEPLEARLRELMIN